MNLIELGSLAAIGSFALAAIMAVIQYWDKIVGKGASILTRLPLILVVIGIISAGFSVSFALFPKAFTEKEMKLSTEEEKALKQLIQDYRNLPGESSRKLSGLNSLGEKAVLKLPLEERPRLEFTDEEIKKLIKTSRIIAVKILRNQVDWDGYADITEAKLKAHEDYQRKIFGVQEVK